MTDVYIHSDHRLNLWDESRDKRGPKLKKTNSRGWKTRLFDLEFFLEELNGRRMVANTATRVAEEVMKRVAAACDLIMRRKSPANANPPMYWWNDNIATVRKECIRGETWQEEAELRGTEMSA